jgi:transketolase
MRTAFVQTLADIAEKDARIVFLTGDLGFMAVEPFKDRFPSRYFNVGVAEQNLVGLATGLAGEGFIPFVYSIATFMSMRPYEFIRNGPVLHNLPVRVVGVGGGFEYGTAGSTHHALEDIGIMRLQRNLRVISPADKDQAANALRSSWDLPQPIYYRIGKDDKRVVEGLDGRFSLGKIERLTRGSDLAVLAVGSVSFQAAEAVELMGSKGVAASFFVVSDMSNETADAIAETLSGFSLAVTVEAHSLAGGLGSLVAEAIADHGLRCRLVRCGVSQPLSPRSGSEAYLLDAHGLTPEEIAKTGVHAVAS